LIDWCLTPTLTIFQLYRGVQQDSILELKKHCQTPPK